MTNTLIWPYSKICVISLIHRKSVKGLQVCVLQFSYFCVQISLFSCTSISMKKSLHIRLMILLVWFADVCALVQTN